MQKYYFLVCLLLFCFACGKDEQKEGKIDTETQTEDGNTPVSKVSNEKGAGARKLQLGKVNGYRVQVYANLEREDVLKYKSIFQRYFPEIESYLVYDDPRYKLRAGDFLDKDQARLLCNRINSVKELNGSFVIKCKVNIVIDPNASTTTGNFDVKPLPTDTSRTVIWVDSGGAPVKFSAEEVLSKEDAKQERRLTEQELKEPTPVSEKTINPTTVKPGDLIKNIPKKVSKDTTKH